MSWILTNLAAVRKMRARVAESLYTITLPSGEEVTYNDRDLEDALDTAISQGEHRLLDALRQTEPREGFEGLVRSLDRSWSSEEGD